ncbi:MAG: hypothetical protein FWE98_00250 [Oscillospiraceae bacterium]|nr:hypothetical protein [Oscillospiraceae bacterium]
MKLKSLLALALACVLALGLFACAPDVLEEQEQAAQITLAVAQSDPLAYLNALITLAAQADTFHMEIPYGMDDIQAGNETLQAARDVVKGYVTSFINKSAGYEKEKFEGDFAASFPALMYTFTQEDFPEGLTISDVLELRVAGRLETLEVDIAENRNTAMKGKSDAEKRKYVLEQMGENAVRDASRLFQIEGVLSLEAIDKLFPEADKAAILAELAKAEDYAVIGGYAVAPTALTLFATVNKNFVDADRLEELQVVDPAQSLDRIREIAFTQKAGLTADAKGVGAFAGAGDFTIALTLTKTLRYKDFDWKAAG